MELRTIARGLAALVIPFMVGGALIADRAIELVLPGRVGAGIAPLAPAAAVFGGSFALLYATAMMLLIFDYRRLLIVVAIVTVATNTVVQALLPTWVTLPQLLWAASAIVLVGGLLTACRFLSAESSLPSAAFMVRTASATGSMSIVLLATRSMPTPTTLLAVPIALLVYGSIHWRLGSFDRQDVEYFLKSRTTPIGNAGQEAELT